MIGPAVAAACTAVAAAASATPATRTMLERMRSSSGLGDTFSTDPRRIRIRRGSVLKVSPKPEEDLMRSSIVLVAGVALAAAATAVHAAATAGPIMGSAKSISRPAFQGYYD